MSILTENETSFFITSPAILFNEDVDTASQWASKYIVANKAIKWVLAKYVEADNANSNGQMWSLADLQNKQGTIRHSPMNIGHRGTEIVGTWTAAELVYPIKGGEEDTSGIVENPYIETLGAFWKYYFPEMLAQVEAAYETGSLFVSMECQGDSITCSGPNGCGETFDYAGPMSDTYCEHVLSREASRQINNPHFLAGALILPPDRPGWNNAAVKELAAKTTDEQKDQTLRMIAAEAPELSPEQWESIMFSIQANAEMASKVDTEQGYKTPPSLVGLQIANSFMARSYH